MVIAVNMCSVVVVNSWSIHGQLFGLGVRAAGLHGDVLLTIAGLSRPCESCTFLTVKVKRFGSGSLGFLLGLGRCVLSMNRLSFVSIVECAKSCNSNVCDLPWKVHLNFNTR